MRGEAADVAGSTNDDAWLLGDWVLPPSKEVATFWAVLFGVAGCLNPNVEAPAAKGEVEDAYAKKGLFA